MAIIQEQPGFLCEDICRKSEELIIFCGVTRERDG